MALEIISIYDVSEGDILLFEGFKDNEIIIITVSEVTEDLLIIPKELGGIDICPENPDTILRIGTIEEIPKVTLLAENMYIGMSKDLQRSVAEKWIDENQVLAYTSN